MMKLLILSAILAQLAVIIAGQAFHVKIHKDGESGECTLLSNVQLKKYRGLKHPSEVTVTKRPAVHGPADSMLDIVDKSTIIEIFGSNDEIIQGHIDTMCKFMKPLEPLVVPQGKRAPEVVKIIDGGDNANRIDVVFMGDGYQAAARQQFFDDIQRLTTEMFEGDTFKSYLPVFNIWAIYNESVDSGIGYNGAKNTPFRLYREAGQLRGIFTGNAQYARQVCTLTGPSGCDYPSLIGNDDFYGGLGGEFVISTKSDRTGTVVLRHEMGHNFVNVGEEYDNGQVYRGVNAATTVNGLGWGAWLTTGNRREERAMYRLLQYPWADLGNMQVRSYSFTSDGSYSRWYCLVSVSAAGEADSLEFTLDGQVLPWTSTGFDDREFYEWKGNTGFSSGSHTFTVRSKTPSTNPNIPRMIASINIHEFGSDQEFVVNNFHISAYPTWDTLRRKTFRPTNAGCLMRNMTHDAFCDVCKEGMWYQFLARISLIDGVDVVPIGLSHNATVRTLQLGQLRPVENQIEGEKLSIRWALNGVDQFQYTDFFTVPNIAAGNWRVTVSLSTPEVRVDPTGLLTDSQTFTVPNRKSET